MAKYTVRIYKEVVEEFNGIDARTPEEATVIAEQRSEDGDEPDTLEETLIETEAFESGSEETA